MEQHIVEGNTSVEAVLLAQKRGIMKTIADKKKEDRSTVLILYQTAQYNIPVERNSRQAIDELAQGRTHGGLLTLCGECRFQILQAVAKRDSVFLALTKGVEGPFNFGYILHTPYAAGCGGVVIPPRNWTTATRVVTRTSIGTSEYLNPIAAAGMEALSQGMKQADIQLIYAQRKDATSLYDCAFPLRLCLVIDGEMHRLSKYVQNHSDQNLFIPRRQDFRNVMTAVASTAVFALELVRQKTVDQPSKPCSFGCMVFLFCIR